jgi:hypothetical protein
VRHAMIRAPLSLALGALLASALAFEQPVAREDWLALFNGRDLEGWVIKIAGHELGDNYGDTFTVRDGVIRVSYDKYASFDNQFGHLFYRRRPYSFYRLVVEYRFVGEQVRGGPPWALRNSGVMFHSQPPETMTRTQDFPISIEAQFLGAGPAGERTSLNVCTPGTEIMMSGQMVKAHCTNSTSRSYRGDEWVRAEIEVHGGERVQHLLDGKPVLVYDGLRIGGGAVSNFDPAAKKDGAPLNRGYIALQAESHPIEFRKVEMLDLAGCMNPTSPSYRSYFVHRDDSLCQ